MKKIILLVCFIFKILTQYRLSQNFDKIFVQTALAGEGFRRGNGTVCLFPVYSSEHLLENSPNMVKYGSELSEEYTESQVMSTKVYGILKPF